MEGIKSELDMHIGQATTKTIWFDFEECCTNLNRSLPLVASYFSQQLDTEIISVWAGAAWVLTKTHKRKLQSILKRFINDYVKCPSCHQKNTKIVTTDETTDLVVCNLCDTKTPRLRIKGSIIPTP